MTRKKVKHAYIPDNSARRATFNKRKKGIIRKVSKLTTLCGIQACAIISNPSDSQTEVWPDLDGTNQVIEKYQNASVIHESKDMNQERFFMQRITKSKDQLKKKVDDNREKKLTLDMFGYLQDKKLADQLTIEELGDFEKLIDKKLKEIDNKIAALSINAT